MCGKGLKSILSVAAPVVGSYFGGPLGAAVASGLDSKFVNHESIGKSLLNAGISAVGSGAFGGSAPNTGIGILDSINGGITDALGPIGSGITGGIKDALGGVGEFLGLGSSAASSPTGASFSAPTAAAGASGGGGIGGAAGAGNAGTFDISKAFGDATGITGLDDKLLALTGNQVGTGAAAGVSSGSGGIADFLSQNKNLLLPAAGLAANAIKGSGEIPGLKQLQGQASQSQALANDTLNSLSTGKLPPGAQGMVDQAISDGEATIRSRYAQMGQSGSTGEAQDIQALHERAATIKYQMAADTTQVGLQALGATNSIYNQIMQAELQKDQGLQDAISNFAASAGLNSAISGLKAA